MNQNVLNLGSGRFRFLGTIGATTLGQSQNQIASQDVRSGTVEIDLEALGWTTDVTVAGLQALEISVVGNDNERGGPILGTVTRRFTQVLALPGGGVLHVPQGERSDHNANFTVRYRTEPKVEGRFGIFSRDTVFAARAHDGSVSYTTLAGNVQLTRIEVCPVLPTPAANQLPPRPVFPPGAPAARELGQGVGNITDASALNSVPNPSVIPILAPRDATENNTARLKVTYYRPASLNLTDTDARLEWSAAPADRVRFFRNECHGQLVRVYGTGAANAADIDVTFTLKFCGQECARFRAVLGHLKTVRCRFNIFKGPAGPHGDPNQSRSRFTAANVYRQMQLMNVYLRQAGIQLALDSDATTNTINPGGGAAITVATGATADHAEYQGIFTIDVPDNQGRNIPWNSVWLRANYRANVVNFIYVKSSSLAGATGFAFKYPEHPDSTNANHRWDFQETGTPSSSCKQHSGVPPDTAADAVTMKVLAGYTCNNALPAGLNGMCMTDYTDPDTDDGRRLMAKTVAHELGHMLSLGHRVEDPGSLRGDYDDEVGFPPAENIMLYYSSPMNQDYDIAQAKIMRRSALIG